MVDDAIYTTVALDYLEKFPLDLLYEVRSFDKWAWSHSERYLPRLTRGHDYGPRHPEWGSHLIRRHDLKKKINRGGRIVESEKQFQIEVDSKNLWRTMKMIEAAVSRSKSLAKRVTKVSETKFSNVLRLMDAPDMDFLSSETQHLFSNFKATFDTNQDMIKILCDHLDRQAGNAVATARAEIAAAVRRTGRMPSDQLMSIFDESGLEELRLLTLDG